MPPIESSDHTKAMLQERNIRKEWLWRRINTPWGKRRALDGMMHHVKAIREAGGRVLHIAVNADVHPNRVVAVFSGRRLRRKRETR